MGIRRIVALPVLAAVMFAAGACGTGEATVAGVPSSWWNTARPDPLTPPGLPKGAAAPRVAPRATAYDSGDTVGTWQLLELRDGGRELVIRYSQGGGCDVAKGVLVLETSHKVALVPMYVEPHTPCFTSDGRHIPTAVVTLSAPLGSRELLHLPAGDKAL